MNTSQQTEEHAVAIYDNRLVRSIIQRREAYASFVRLVVQLVSYISAVLCWWLFIITTHPFYGVGAIVFFAVAISHKQLTNHSIVLERKGPEDVDDN